MVQENSLIPILVISGATAVGKSAAAIECAKILDGEIVSCDSMQIYKHLNIGTAKITEIEKQGIPHHLIDIIDPDCEFSVSDYVELAKIKISEIHARNKLPIITGGTGLYIKSLLFQHKFANSEKSNIIRDSLKELLEKEGKEYLHNELRKIDIDSANKININDTKRIIRALEIYKQTGIPKSLQQNDEIACYNHSHFQICMDRELLYARINSRVNKMLTDGLLEEVKSLQKYKLCQSMSAIGYRELLLYIDSKLTYEESVNLIQQNSRHYAKRQITFFNSFKDAHKLDNSSDNLNSIVKQIIQIQTQKGTIAHE